MSKGQRNRTAFTILNQLKAKSVPRDEASFVISEWNQGGLPANELNKLVTEVYGY